MNAIVTLESVVAWLVASLLNNVIPSPEEVATRIMNIPLTAEQKQGHITHTSLLGQIIADAKASATKRKHRAWLDMVADLVKPLLLAERDSAGALQLIIETFSSQIIGFVAAQSSMNLTQRAQMKAALDSNQAALEFGVARQLKELFDLNVHESWVQELEEANDPVDPKLVLRRILLDVGQSAVMDSSSPVNEDNHTDG